MNPESCVKSQFPGPTGIPPARGSQNHKGRRQATERNVTDSQDPKVGLAGPSILWHVLALKQEVLASASPKEHCRASWEHYTHICIREHHRDISSTCLGEHHIHISWAASWEHHTPSSRGAPYLHLWWSTVQTLHKTLFCARCLGSVFLHKVVPGVTPGKCLLNKCPGVLRSPFFFFSLPSPLLPRQDLCTEAGLEVPVSTLQPPESWDPSIIGNMFVPMTVGAEHPGAPGLP